jgi:hypothetical protein
MKFEITLNGKVVNSFDIFNDCCDFAQDLRNNDISEYDVEDDDIIEFTSEDGTGMEVCHITEL